MRIALTNFTGGEIAPTLSARYDLSRYKNSVQCMQNFLPNVHGIAERRPGTKFLADLGTGVENDALLIPFSFNVEKEQNYILILSHKLLRIANHDGLIENISITTPWEERHLSTISFAQVGDIVYMAHKDYPLQKITRSGFAPDYIWEIKEVALNTSIPAPAKPTVSFSSGSGYILRYKVVAVDANGKQSLASEAGEVNGKHPSDWVVGNYARVSWTAVEGAIEYNIYREEAGYFGFIGISEGLSFTDNNYEADIADTPKEDWNPFEDGNNPGVVSFHQQRMVLAATPKSPQAFYMSRVSDFENFRKSRPLQDDDPVEYLIASGNIDAITWAASFGDLLLGTSSSEYKASGDGGVITASNANITAQSYWGSSNLFPIIIGNSIMHVQRHGARVRDLFYSLEKDGYAGNDLSIMAPHLFDGHSLRQWAYQQTPFSSIWVVRDDGVLLALTYMKEHDIWGWSRHLTAGKVRSVAMVSGENADDIFMVVQRNIQGIKHFYLEKLAPRWQESNGIEQAFFMDAGKSILSNTPSDTITNLEHLEKCFVSALADGSPIENLQVENGSITLPYAARLVHVGLPYTSIISPQPMEGDLQNGSTLGQHRAYGQCSIRVNATVGGKYGADMDNLFDFPYVPAIWGEAVQPFSGHIDFIPGGGQSTDTSIWIVQDRVLPFSISALIMNMDLQGG